MNLLAFQPQELKYGQNGERLYAKHTTVIYRFDSRTNRHYLDKYDVVMPQGLRLSYDGVTPAYRNLFNASLAMADLKDRPITDTDEVESAVSTLRDAINAMYDEMYDNHERELLEKQRLVKLVTKQVFKLPKIRYNGLHDSTRPPETHESSAS